MHGQRPLFEAIKNARHIILYDAHDETIEQGDVLLGTGAGQNSPARQKAEIPEHAEELFLPGILIFAFHRRCGPGHPQPGVFNAVFHDRMIPHPAVSALPDILADRWFKRIVYCLHECATPLSPAVAVAGSTGVF